MRPVYYDLHIHTALSPCADDDMTPGDIAGMAFLNDLDLIAITDHNTLANAESVIKAANELKKKQGRDLVVLPGIEVSTAEEVHVLCLFSTIETAKGFETELNPFYSTLTNRSDIFGAQILYNENDRITGKMERMLIAPTSIMFDDLFTLTHKYNGAFIPAHIDRGSFSVISNLGFLPPHLRINTVEVTAKGIEDGFVSRNANRFPHSRMIFSSDAHQLWTISEKKHFILLPELSGEAAIAYLR